jgi:hypothetical protein
MMSISQRYRSSIQHRRFIRDGQCLGPSARADQPAPRPRITGTLVALLRISSYGVLWSNRRPSRPLGNNVPFQIYSRVFYAQAVRWHTVTAPGRRETALQLPGTNESATAHNDKLKPRSRNEASGALPSRLPFGKDRGSKRR